MTNVVAPGPQVVVVEQVVDVTVLKVDAPEGVKTLTVAEQLGTAVPAHDDADAVLEIGVEVGGVDVAEAESVGELLGLLVGSGSLGSGDGGSVGGVAAGKPPPPPPPPPPPGQSSGIKQAGSHSGPVQAQATVGMARTPPPPLGVDE